MVGNHRAGSIPASAIAVCVASRRSQTVEKAVKHGELRPLPPTTANVHRPVTTRFVPPRNAIGAHKPAHKWKSVCAPRSPGARGKARPGRYPRCLGFLPLSACQSRFRREPLSPAKLARKLRLWRVQMVRPPNRKPILRRRDAQATCGGANGSLKASWPLGDDSQAVFIRHDAGETNPGMTHVWWRHENGAIERPAAAGVLFQVNRL